MTKTHSKARNCGPLITQVIESHTNGERFLVSSRRLRRGLEKIRLERKEQVKEKAEQLSLLFISHPRVLSWWIGALFMVGSSLFAAGCLMSMYGTQLLSNRSINLTYFIGSIFFTTAAYGQLLQAINANIAQLTDQQAKMLSWRWWARGLRSAGFLAAASQFIGTVLFNINTFDAWQGTHTTLGTTVLVWIPNMAGSILFLVSSFFAWIEIFHDDYVRRFLSLTWWVIWLNILGAVFFQISAIYAWTNPLSGNVANSYLSIVFTLWGALCFFVGAYLSNLELKVG